MKRKVILQGREARLKLKEGVDLVANIIKTTLGPKGRNVIVKNMGPLPPRSMNDGYYIADHIQHDDPIVNAAVDMTKEVCKKTNDVAGDATTTTAILSQVIFDEGLKEVDDNGKNPVDIKKELNDDLESLFTELDKISTPVKNAEDVKNIATISGNNDPEIGKALSDIYENVGSDAAMLVEKSKESKIRIETIKGIYFDKGFGEARAFANNPRNMTAEYKDVRVLCVDEKLEYVDDIRPFFEKLLELDEYKERSTNLKILIIANELPVRMDAATLLAENNRMAFQGMLDKNGVPMGFFVVGVEAPEFGPTRSEMLDDIAIATGGVCVSKANGLTLKDADPNKVLGRADKIVVSTNSTTIIGGNANKELLEERINMIKGEIDQLHVNAKITREKFEKRLKTISSGVGIIHAGGMTEMESKERHLRIEDAVLAVQSALQQGVVAGGGYTFYQLSKKAKTNILKAACLSIPRQIAENAGKNPDEVLKVLEETGKGYNALTDKFVDLFADGVLDATKVIRTAFGGAVSFVGLLLTTSSCVIEEIIEEKK